MDIDVTFLKKLVDDTVLTEAKCTEIMRSLLAQEDLKNPMVDRIIELLGAWASTPPVEILRKLEELQSQKNNERKEHEDKN